MLLRKLQAVCSDLLGQIIVVGRGAVWCAGEERHDVAEIHKPSVQFEGDRNRLLEIGIVKIEGDIVVPRDELILVLLALDMSSHGLNAHIEPLWLDKVSSGTKSCTVLLT